jgi:stearoyl-CoA desaturase (delta-9 desaturase)
MHFFPETIMELSVVVYGLIGHLALWQYLLIVVFLAQLTIMAVTLYLHRQEAHGAIKLHPAIEHFFRFWLWLTTGMKTDEWVAVHKKHHKRCEMPDDPHSPVQKGLWHVLVFGVLYYREAAKLKSTREYVRGAAGAMLPKDWIERALYTKHNWLGLKILLVTQVALFGIPGFFIWLAQYLWIPIHAAGIINGVGHALGYRNADTRNGEGTGPDASTNIVPWGLWIGGEELHNNHHLYPTSAKFSQRWFEIDIGWGVIRALQVLGLVEVKHVSRLPVISSGVVTDEELLRIFQHHRFLIAKWFRKAIEREQTVSAHLRERFEEFMRGRGKASVTKEEFVQWLIEVRSSGKMRLVKFAEKVRSLRERRLRGV